MNKKTLPGIGLLGVNYNVLGLYARAESVQPLTPLFSFDFTEFDPNDSEWSKRINVFGEEFYYPELLEALEIESSELHTKNVKSLGTFKTNVEATLRTIGVGKSFKAALYANFEGTYLHNTSYYSYTQEGVIKAYSINLDTTTLEQFLTNEADGDINGKMQPEKLIERYGCFFLRGGIFGGCLVYSENITKYAYEDETKAKDRVMFNYDKFITGRITSAVEIDKKHSYDESDGRFQAVGGNAEVITLGVKAWSESLLKDGGYTLIDFNEGYSLERISSLAKSHARREAIDAAIDRYLSEHEPPKFQLEVNKANTKHEMITGDYDDTPEITVHTEHAHQVIVGAAFKVASHEIKQLAIRVLDLETNRLDWITSDGRIFNYEGDYEMINDIPGQSGFRSVAVVGMGFAVQNNEATSLYLYYKPLHPQNLPHSTYLGDRVHTADGGHSNSPEHDANFKPDDDTPNVITGIGLSCRINGISTMKIWYSNLMLKEIN